MAVVGMADVEEIVLGMREVGMAEVVMSVLGIREVGWGEVHGNGNEIRWCLRRDALDVQTIQFCVLLSRSRNSVLFCSVLFYSILLCS